MHVGLHGAMGRYNSRLLLQLIIVSTAANRPIVRHELSSTYSELSTDVGVGLIDVLFGSLISYMIASLGSYRVFVLLVSSSKVHVS